MHTTIPLVPLRSMLSVSSLTCFDNEPWCNSIFIKVFSLRIEAKNSDSPLVLVNKRTGEFMSDFSIYSIIESATSEIEPFTNFTSTSYFLIDLS